MASICPNTAWLVRVTFVKKKQLKFRFQQVLLIFMVGESGTRKFLTGQAEYSWSCECLRSCLAVERSMMKSSTLFQHSSADSPPVHLASTRCNLRDRCSQAFPIFHHSSASVYYTERKPKNKKAGEAWEWGYMWWPVDAWVTHLFLSLISQLWKKNW